MAGQLLPWIDSGDAEGNRNSMQNFLGDGVDTSFDFNFAGGYIDVAHVKAYIYRTASGLTEAIDPVVLTGPNTIQVIPAVPAGDYLVVYRDTPKDQPLIDYSTGAVLDELNLDTANKQAVFAAAEMSDRFDAINASSADAIERSFTALTIANQADDKADIAIADSAAAVITADAAEVTAANALQVAEDAVAAATGFQTNLEFYTGDDVTSRGADWQTGSVASPGNQRWFAGTDTASDFTLDRYNDAGVLQGSAVKVDRQTGEVTVAAKIHGVVDGTAASDAATLGQIDAQKIDKDGTLDFAAHQKLFNSTPTDPLHAASKGYVDAGDIREPNLILNPHGGIRQQSTDQISGPTGGTYFADQWLFAQSSVSGVVVANVGTDRSVSAYDPHHLLMFTSTAKASLTANEFAVILQPLEGVNHRRLFYGTSAAKGSWLQFRARGSQAGTASVAIRNGGNNRSWVQTFAVTTTPTLYSFFVPGDTAGTWPTDNTQAGNVVFCFASGSTNTTSNLGVWQAGNFFAGPGQSNMMDTVNRVLSVTDVDWRGTSLLLPFVPIDWQQELARCQRYYWKIRALNGQHYPASVFAFLTNQLNVTMRNPVPMRVAPTSIAANLVGAYKADGASVAANSITPLGNTTDSIGFNMTMAASTFTVGQGSNLTSVNDASFMAAGAQM